MKMNIRAICGLLMVCATAVQADGPTRARAIIQAKDRATLSTQISASVLAMPFRAGKIFKAGDLLVKLDCAVFDAQVNKVLAEVEAAQKKYENDAKLHELRSVGDLELAISAASLRASQAELDMAQINQKRCDIYAPWDGRVVSWIAHPYETLQAHQPIIDIIASHAFEVEAVVPSKWIAKIKIGQKATVFIEETGFSYPIKIETIGSEIHPASQTIVIRGEITGQTDGLLSGMTDVVHLMGADQ